MTGGRLAVTVSAIIGPLHDPLRLAEEIAVLDLLSGGRLVTVAGIGYRPEEYALFDVDWKRRGRLQDELLETLLKAWTGEPFEYRGRTVRVTPRPYTDPHPLLLVGGSSKAAARRAARLGLPFFPSAHLPELEAYYKERLVEYGTEGWTMMPAAETPLLHVAEDPDRAWAQYGKHFLHEARTYASWQSGEIRSAVKSGATTVEELRAEGVYRIVTPEECVALGHANYVLHPLSGGMPVEEGGAACGCSASGCCRGSATDPSGGTAYDAALPLAYDTAAPARAVAEPGRRRGYGERGSGDLALLPEFGEPWRLSPSPPASCPWSRART